MSKRPFAVPTMIVFAAFSQFAALETPIPAQDQKLSRVSSLSECPASDGDKIAITVEVTDKSDYPVTGLEATDFRVFDNRQPEKILSFLAIDQAHPPPIP